MISLHQLESSLTRRQLSPLSPLGVSLAAVVSDAHAVSLILSVADFCGMQQDGKGGEFQLWTLRKPIAGHPAGSTVTRDTILRAAKLPNYGVTAVQPAADFAAVESPMAGT